MKLNRLTMLMTMLLAMVFALNAGAPPTVMAVPDDNWAQSNGYGELKDFKGKKHFVVDYDACFRDTDLSNVMTTLNDMMQEYGLPLVDATAQNQEDDEDDAFDEMDEIEVGPLDDLANKAKPDMLVKIGWNANSDGFHYTLQGRIDGYDTYSSKRTASKSFSRVFESTQPIGLAMQQALTDIMSDFTRKLQDAFDDIQTNGREVGLRISVQKGSGVNLATEFNGETLATHIANWMEQNTVNHQFNERSASENRLVFNEVRIPLKSATGSTYNARAFSESLKKYLQSNFGLTVINRTASLGRGRLIISD